MACLTLNGNAVTDKFRLDTLFVISIDGVSIVIGILIVSLLQPAVDIAMSLLATFAGLFNIGLGHSGDDSKFAAVHPCANRRSASSEPSREAGGRWDE